MSSRVTDDQALHALTWARNYGDVKSWKRVAKSGAKWLVVLTAKGVTIESTGQINQAWLEGAQWADVMLGPRAQDVVPGELVLSNREVLLLCYGMAVGGERAVSRSEYRTAWDRGENEPKRVAEPSE